MIRPAARGCSGRPIRSG